MGDGSAGVSTAELGIPQKDLEIKTPQKATPEKSREQQIREFSKSTWKGERTRSETAAQIMQERKATGEKTSEIKTTNTSLEQLGKIIEQHQAQVEELQAQIEAAATALEAREVSLLKRIYDKVFTGTKRRLHLLHLYLCFLPDWLSG